MKRQLSYIKAVVICHGKSERTICSNLKSTLKINIEIDAKNNGENSIQITSLTKFLNSRKYKTRKDFLIFFKDKINKIDKNFKIFTIMDTDDCTKYQKEAYLNKSMFKGHWLRKYIVPIANSPELESVLVQSGIKFSNKGIDRKKEYGRIFSSFTREDYEQLEVNLRKCPSTNMNESIEFCLNL